ncbi:hypothetical protein JQC91_07415 [Jannaschia sp. Os4]|uniref:hypothetical protein n=1 Tax=Jannaschia sp. Os4 TaxID=2807617 RepID=UPI00193980FA|nr:hypothetical protein [Jannaschia sp. Os4]MBM2576130.1 hypothetical protein [Jannaschia sp. Os4]
MPPLDGNPRRPARRLRLLTVRAPLSANPSPNAAALYELLSRLGLKTAWVDNSLVSSSVNRTGLVATAARMADYVVVVGDPGDLDALRVALGPIDLRLHEVDLLLADARMEALAADGIWPLGRVILDGAPLAA